MTDAVPEIHPDSCYFCNTTHLELEAVGRVLYECDRCGVDVCSDCSANTDDAVVCESCATPEEWERG